MSDVFVNLGVATICFLKSCYPALVGEATKPGIYTLQQYTTDVPAYGGDLLVFSEDTAGVYAIHRFVNVLGQHRKERLESDNVVQRKNITHGCVNVKPEVYEKLVSCCSNSKLYIIP